MKKISSNGIFVCLCSLLASGFIANCGDDERADSELDQCLKACQKSYGTCADEAIDEFEDLDELCFDFEDGEECYDSFGQKEVDEVLGLCKQSCRAEAADAAEEEKKWTEFNKCWESKLSKECRNLLAQATKAWAKVDACAFNCAMDLDCQDWYQNDFDECEDECDDLFDDAVDLDDDLEDDCMEELLEGDEDCEDKAPDSRPDENECAPGCPTEYINDGSCDDECNVAACRYDGSDCDDDISETDECAPGCPTDYVNDGECDDECDVAACRYDGSDCDDDISETDECAPGCPTEYINDGLCDDECDVAACRYDGSDCA
ncbi:MAG: LNR domain-containing protein [Myxococcota bacterium]|nr:LNR domain-containing protein [Myxococcota bacterium]